MPIALILPVTASYMAARALPGSYATFPFGLCSLACGPGVRAKRKAVRRALSRMAEGLKEHAGGVSLTQEYARHRY